MPRGSAVIRYDGKRGVVWRIKYADSTGQQVMETLGPERDGWNRKKADAELRERLVRVERRGYRRPKPLTFGDYADTWHLEGQRRRGWKASTIRQYSCSDASRTHSGTCRSLRSGLGTSPSTSPRRRPTTAPRPSAWTSRSCTRSSPQQSGRNSSRATRPSEPSGQRCRDDAGASSNRSRSLASRKNPETSKHVPYS